MKNRNVCRGLVFVVLVVAVSAVISGREDDDLTRKALNDSTFTWRSTESDRIRMYYQMDSFAEKHRMMILRSVATALDEVLELLGESGYDTVLNVFYLESREDMKKIVGRPYSGFSDWTSNAVFIVLHPEWRSFEKHEIAHVITMGVWGPPDVTSRWMIEGIAVYIDGWCREYTVDEVAFHLLSNGQLPPLKELFDDFSGLGEIRAGFYSASVIGFIRDTYGVGALRSLWFNGVRNGKELLGDDVTEIENSWKNYLRRTVRKETEVDLDAINTLGCG